MANQLFNLFGALGLDATLQAIRDRLPITLGQKTSANSLSVTLSSDESTLTVSGTVNANTGGLTDAELRADPVPVEIQGSLGTADTKSLGSPLVSGDVGLVTNTVIHGVTTGGGGGYVDVKVNPSGALVVDASDSVVALDAATLTALENVIVSGTVTVNAGTGTFAVSAASLPLPAGAATESTLATVGRQRFASSKTLTYTGENLTQVDEVIGGNTWRTTLTYSGSTLTGVSTQML